MDVKGFVNEGTDPGWFVNMSLFASVGLDANTYPVGQSVVGNVYNSALLPSNILTVLSLLYTTALSSSLF